ncbi:hypothetical protein [Thermopirellula anaerolimosa]
MISDLRGGTATVAGVSAWEKRGGDVWEAEEGWPPESGDSAADSLRRPIRQSLETLARDISICENQD